MVAVAWAVIVAGPDVLVLRVDRDRADVDDARELADPLEERPEVVIRALELQPDRPLGVQLTRRDGLRREPEDGQVGLRGHRPEPVAADRQRPVLPAGSTFSRSSWACRVVTSRRNSGS